MSAVIGIATGVDQSDTRRDGTHVFRGLPATYFRQHDVHDDQIDTFVLSLKNPQGFVTISGFYDVIADAAEYQSRQISDMVAVFN